MKKLLIKTLRESTGLSQRDFAAKFHINIRTLQAWEQGITAPPEHVLFMLSCLVEPKASQSSKFLISCERNSDQMLMPSEMCEHDLEMLQQEVADALTNLYNEHNDIWKDKFRDAFLDICVGDVVLCHDEYSHDYTEHELLITSVEFDKEYITDTNPKGMVCYGEDLNRDELADDYMTLVHEGNFVQIHHQGGEPKEE